MCDDDFQDCDPKNILDEIAMVAGQDVADTVARAFGGRTLYVPARLPKEHPLVEALGDEAAAILSQHFKVGRTGISLLIPMGKHAEATAQKVIDLSNSGWTAPRIASELGIHIRTVYRIRARHAGRRAS